MTKTLFFDNSDEFNDVGEVMDEFSDLFYQNRYVDVTDKLFKEYLPGLAKDLDSTVQMFNIGQPRSGKTLNSLGIIHVLMQDQSRILCPWGSPNLVEPLDICYPGRVYYANHLDEIQNGSILFLDEANIQANAKKSLTIVNRKFEEAMAFKSHKKIIVIMNAQTLLIVRGFRHRCEIVIWLRNTPPFLDDLTGEFVRNNKDVIVNLPKEECLIQSSAYGMEIYKTNFWGKKEPRVGIIRGDKRERFPYDFGEILSKHMKDMSLDTSINRENEQEEIINQVVLEMLSLFPAKLVRQSGFIRTVRGYYYHLQEDNKRTYIYLNDRKLWGVVQDSLRLEADLKILENIKKEKDEDMVLNEVIFEPGDDFPSFCRRTLEKQNYYLAELVYYFLKGFSQKEIGHNLKYGVDKINADLQKIRFGVDDKGRKRLGYMFERWFALKHGGGEVGGNSGEIDYVDPFGNLYELKCECYYRVKTITYYQSKDIAKKTIERAKREGKTITFVHYNPGWKPFNPIRIKTINPNGEDRFLIENHVKNDPIPYVVPGTSE